MRREFRLVFDARCIRAPRTGVGNAAFRHLEGIDRLLSRKPESPWRVFAIRDSTDMSDAAFRERWRRFRNLHLIDVACDPSAHPRGDWWQQIELPRLLKRMGAHVVYSPAYVGPWRTGKTARMVTVHDDMIWTQPASYPRNFRAYLSLFTRISARTAHRVVFPSADARSRCLKILGVPGNRAGVVPNGIEASRYRAPDPPPAREAIALCIASAEDRKNHRVLVRAMEPGAFLNLRFIGFSDTAGERLEELRAIDGGENWTIVPQADERAVAGELARAAMVVLPSLGEGFGLPVTEAMAAGTPLVLSDIAVFREVAGEAARYVDPHDPDAWRSAMRETLAGGPEVEKRVAIGRERVRLFGLERCAKILLREAQRAWTSYPSGGA